MNTGTLIELSSEKTSQLFKLGIQRFSIQNRRYLGNKYKLLNFIEEILNKKCPNYSSLCDIFAGTGVVGEYFNKEGVKIISNDILSSNFVCLKAFIGIKSVNYSLLENKIEFLNSLFTDKANYFSENFGATYFTVNNARKIGSIREKINQISEDEEARNILLCSLLYAVDKVANTVGHYDAYRKKLDSIQELNLLMPQINFLNNGENEVYKEDANELIRRISCDVLYIDPPYNSRQYSDSYHLLENLVEWKKPNLAGIARKMDRSHIKSQYCLKNAKNAFEDLIHNAQCNHILVSYNNTGESKDGRSNARIRDEEIIKILAKKGNVEIFEKDYRAFTTGKSDSADHTERIFYCKVIK